MPPDEGPEWENVEQERDYWKGLALSYGAKLKAIEHTMAGTWTVIHTKDGKVWVVDEQASSFPIDGLSDIAKKP